MVICLEQGADLHMAQLMPLPLTVSCSSKIQIGSTFLVPAPPGSPGQGPLNGCVLIRYFRLVSSCIVCVCKVELLLSGDYKVRDGGLVDEFKAVRLEFHWSNTSRRGSEHYINDTAFPLEVCLLCAGNESVLIQLAQC